MLPLTSEEKATINNHFQEIPRNMLTFRDLIDVNMADEDKKRCLLAMIGKFEEWIGQVKEIIKKI